MIPSHSLVHLRYPVLWCESFVCTGLLPTLEVYLDHLSSHVHDTNHMLVLDQQPQLMIVALAYVLQSRVDLFLDVRVEDLLVVIQILSGAKQPADELGSFDVVRYLIEGVGRSAISRYEFRLTRKVEEDDIFMNWTGVVAFQVMKKTVLTIYSVTTVQVGVYATGFLSY